MRVTSLTLLITLALSTTHAAQAPVAGPATEAWETYAHTVVKGDTLIGLSRALLADARKWPLIRRLNRVREPRRLQAGRTLRIPIDLLRSLPGSAEILWVRGPVRVQTADGASRVALLGGTLGPGATIVTGAAQSVRLRLSTGGVVTVGEHAQIAFRELRSFPSAGSHRTLISIDRGRLETVGAPVTAPGQRYEIRTPVVTTAVKGTDFRVGVNETGTAAATEVTAGLVDLARDTEALAVPAGFGAIARQGEALSAPRALLPAVVTGGIQAVLTRLPTRLRWPAIAGAARYRVQVAPEAGGPPLDDRLVTGAEAFWPDLPDAAYRLTIRGIDADGLEGLDASYPFTVEARPEPPIAQAPVVGAAIIGSEVSLEWTRPAGVPAFDLQLAKDPSFAETTIARSALTEPTLALTLAPGAYVWRIASRQDQKRGPWSDAMAFTVRARPPAGPLAEGAVDLRQLTLRWPAGMPGDRYRVQVASDGTFATTLVDRQVAEPTLAMPRPTPGPYVVRVSLVNADGIEGPFGPAQSLVVSRPPRRRWWLLLLLPLGATAGAIIGTF